MLDIDKLYYIMDYSGNYYRINDKNDLVVAKSMDEAAVFSFVEANKRINAGHKNKFYMMTPVEDNHQEHVVEVVSPTLEYEITQIDWKEYLTHFTYVIEALSGYRDSLIKAESDVDLKVCDILHYIELCDTSMEEAASLVDLLKECREHRRDVKDEIICLDAFQRSVGTSANLAKAKDALKSIKKLETRKYTPRKLSELFDGGSVKMPTTGEKPREEQPITRTITEECFVGERENEDMEYVRRETIFDGQENNWMTFAVQQAEFYKNANQYIVNLKLDIEDIEDEISDLMDEIDSSNCNVTQGYKLFKRLKELRIRRKEKEQELQCLYILTERFDVNAMTDECEDNVYELERLLHPDENIKELEAMQNTNTEMVTSGADIPIAV